MSRQKFWRQIRLPRKAGEANLPDKTYGQELRRVGPAFGASREKNLLSRSAPDCGCTSLHPMTCAALYNLTRDVLGLGRGNRPVRIFEITTQRRIRAAPRTGSSLPLACEGMGDRTAWWGARPAER